MRRHGWVALLGALTMLAGAVASCKSEKTRAVTLDLGVDNGGSAGFACTEERSPTCDAVLGCALSSPVREVVVQCLTAKCQGSDGGVASNECLRLAACVKEKPGAAADCYQQICATQPPLAARAASGDGGAEMHLYVDYIRLSGTPGCRVAELRKWCATGNCSVVRRRCVALTLSEDVRSSPESATRAISAAWAAGRTLDDDAPDEPILVRVTAFPKTGACEPAEEELANLTVTEGAVGCAYSCPTILTSATNALTIDFDRAGPSCTEEELRPCLSLFTGDARAAP